MIVLIVVLLFALAIAYFALQNTATVTVTLIHSVFPSVPLYLVILASLFAGVVLSWIISWGGSLTSLMTLRGKDQRIREAENVIDGLKQKVHTLEVDNARLRGKEPAPVSPLSASAARREEERQPSLFERLRQRYHFGT